MVGGGWCGWPVDKCQQWWMDGSTSQWDDHGWPSMDSQLTGNRDNGWTTALARGADGGMGGWLVGRWVAG